MIHIKEIGFRRKVYKNAEPADKKYCQPTISQSNSLEVISEIVYLRVVYYFL